MKGKRTCKRERRDYPEAELVGSRARCDERPWPGLDSEMWGAMGCQAGQVVLSPMMG